MSVQFAEKMLDSMVDESGHCGERGLSAKQFDVLSGYLEPTDWRDAGGWDGEHAFKTFYQRDWEGNVGKYHVKLNELQHFHTRHSVVSIDLRPADELAREARARELRDLIKNSEWQGEEKERLDMELTLIYEHVFERTSYNGWDVDLYHIYTLADDQGNCYVWKTTAWLDCHVTLDDGRSEYAQAEPGDVVKLRATVKGHDEYRGVKQTVLTRASVSAINGHKAA